jgi:hypothetical protein
MLRQPRKRKLSAGLRRGAEATSSTTSSWSDETGELLEHFGGTEDYLLAAELYEAALKRWPKARIQMKEAARISMTTNGGLTDLLLGSTGPVADQYTGLHRLVRLPSFRS